MDDHKISHSQTGFRNEGRGDQPEDLETSLRATLCGSVVVLVIQFRIQI